MSKRTVNHNGQSKSLSAWSRETGISAQLIKYRLDTGWPIADALTTPAKELNRARALRCAKAKERHEQKVTIAFADVLPAWPAFADAKRREAEKMRRDLRRALRQLIRDTEQRAATIGRHFAIGVASLIDEADRGVGRNFPKNERDRMSSSAQESTELEFS